MTDEEPEIEEIQSAAKEDLLKLMEIIEAQSNRGW